MSFSNSGDQRLHPEQLEPDPDGRQQRLRLRGPHLRGERRQLLDLLPARVVDGSTTRDGPGRAHRARPGPVASVATPSWSGARPPVRVDAGRRPPRWPAGRPVGRDCPSPAWTGRRAGGGRRTGWPAAASSRCARPSGTSRPSRPASTKICRGRGRWPAGRPAACAPTWPAEARPPTIAATRPRTASALRMPTSEPMARLSSAVADAADQHRGQHPGHRRRQAHAGQAERQADRADQRQPQQPQLAPGSGAAPDPAAQQRPGQQADAPAAAQHAVPGRAGVQGLADQEHLDHVDHAAEQHEHAQHRHQRQQHRVGADDRPAAARVRRPGRRCRPGGSGWSARPAPPR